MPSAGLEAFQAGLVHGRQIGQDRGALERGHRQRAHLPRFDMTDHGSRRGEHHLVVASDHILQGGRGTFVGHVHDVDVCFRLEQFTGKMRGRAIAGRSKIDLAGLRLAQIDQLRQRTNRHFRIDHQDIGLSPDQRNGDEILLRVVS